jgi:uncharacterized protein YjbI with pentapeptide repeats
MAGETEKSRRNGAGLWHTQSQTAELQVLGMSAAAFKFHSPHKGNTPQGAPLRKVRVRKMDDLGRCYFLLGVEPGAPAEQIKEAWRDLAQVWHPDRFGGNERLQHKAQEKLKEINQAYEKLRNHQGAASGAAAATAAYDHFGYDHPGYDGDEPGVDPIEVLRQGVSAWNLWRKKYSNLRPNLQSANLNGMRLEGIDLREADLSSAALQNCDLYKANLSSAKVVAARLQRSDLSRALLLGANLRLADLSEADLSGADLSEAVLARCKLFGANLVATNFCGADLSEAAGLTAQQMAYTTTDPKTRLPAYL